MKPIPPPPVEGKTEWERFDNATRKIIDAASKAAIKPEVKPQPKAEEAK